MFNIWVFGYESDENYGGWGLYYKTGNKELAIDALQSILTKYNEEDVEWDFVI